MFYETRMIIDGVTVTTEAAEDAPSIENIRLTEAVSANGMAIGATGSNRLTFNLRNPWKQSFDGSIINLQIHRDSLGISEMQAQIEEEVGESTDYELIDDTGNVVDVEDTEEPSEDATAEEIADAVALDQELTESLIEQLEGEDIIVTDPALTDEADVDEWISLGTFHVTGQMGFDVLKITAYDSMALMVNEFKTSETTLQGIYNQLAAEIQAQYGVTVDPMDFSENDMTIDWNVIGSHRDAIGCIAGLMGGYATIDGTDNSLGISYYTYSDTILIKEELLGYSENSGGEMVIGAVSCDVGYLKFEPELIEAGAGQPIAFVNPFATEEICESILNQYKGMRFTGANIVASWTEDIQAGQFVRVMSADEYRAFVAMRNAIEAGSDVAQEDITQIGAIVLINRQTIELGGDDATAYINSDAPTQLAQQIKPKAAEQKKIEQLANQFKTLSGVTVYFQPEEPTPPEGGFKDGDTWYKTVSALDPLATNMYVYQDGEWISTQFDGGEMIRAGTITANQVAAGEVFTQKLEMKNLKLTGGSVSISAAIDNSAIALHHTTTDNRGYSTVMMPMQFRASYYSDPAAAVGCSACYRDNTIIFIKENAGVERPYVFVTYDENTESINLGGAGGTSVIAAANTTVGSSSYCKYNKITRIVDFCAYLTYTPTANVTAQTRIKLASISAAYAPAYHCAVDCYRDTTGSVQWFGMLNSKGELYLRPNAALTSGTAYSVYVHVTYMY